MNRILVHMTLVALLLACSQQSEAVYDGEETVREEESTNQMEQQFNDWQEIYWEDDLLVLETEKDEADGFSSQELVSNQKNKKEKLVKLFAKQKMEEFIDLWSIYADVQTKAEMKSIAKEELKKLVVPEIWMRIDTMQFSKRNLGKIKFIALINRGEYYHASFSFKLDETKLQTHAFIKSYESDNGRVWIFTISAIQ